MRTSTIRALPRGVIALGLVSLFMDVSSEMIHALLPFFLVGTLGLSALTVGLIEGMAEATASVTKVFSGVLSDWMGRRKPLVLLGYGLAALTKPLFPLASSAGAIVVARFLDRVGKGIRGAPRDALVADITPASLRGAAYGARQSMDTAGAFLGPSLGVLLMALFGGEFRPVFWIAVVPAFASVAILIFGVQEPAEHVDREKRPFPLRRAEMARLGGPFWRTVAVLAVLTLARFSEAFLLLRAAGAGLSATWAPTAIIVMNLVYAMCAYPLGWLADRVERRLLLVAGIGCLIAADAMLASADSSWWVYAGCAAWGLHMGATQGLLSALVADAAPADLRATAFGLFHLVAGVALLAASALAGFLWLRYGPAVTFLSGAGLAAASAAGALIVLPRRKTNNAPVS